MGRVFVVALYAGHHGHATKNGTYYGAIYIWLFTVMGSVSRLACGGVLACTCQ